MSHCTCETCICFMLKVFINFMFVWLSLLKGVVGGCVLFTCHGQFLSHPNVVTHPKLSFSGGGKRYSPAGYQSLVWSSLKTNQSLIPEWTMPNLKGCPCSHIETNRTITPDKHRLRKGKRVRRASEIIRCAIFSFCDSAFIY